DVYSLGVLLYELLTGTTPFEKSSLAKISIDDLRKMIREQDPPRPSARITTMEANLRSTMADRRRIDQRRIIEQLRGELDWIVMKALEKDRNRRYESASAFAADVQRYLNNEQVQACPPTLWYRLQKFSRENRVLLTTTGVCLLMLIAASGISIAYAVQAQTARKDADEQRKEAIAAKEESDRRLKQSRLDLNRALKSLDTIVSEACSVEFAQLPGVENIRSDILQKAMVFYEEIIAEHDNDVYARGHRAKAMHNIASIHQLEGDNAKYRHELNNAIAEMETVLADAPEDNTFREYMVAMLAARLHVGYEAGSVEDAKRCVTLTLQMKESGAFVDPTMLARLTLRVAEMLGSLNPEADKYVKQSLQITSDAGIDPIPAAIIWQAAQNAEKGKLAEAIAQYTVGIELYDRLAADPSNRYADGERCRAAIQRAKLAALLERRGEVANAEAMYRRAFADALSLCSDYSMAAWYRGELQSRCIDLMWFLNRYGRISEASPVVAALEQQFPNSRTVFVAKAMLAELEGRKEDVRRFMEAAKGLSPDDTVLLNRYVEFLIGQKDFPAALREVELSLKLNPNQWGMFKRRGLVYFHLGNFEAAVKDISTALKGDPSDLSAITWIGIEEIISCPDPRFHTEWLNLMNQTVESHGGVPEVLRLRAIFQTLMGEPQKASADLKAWTASQPLTAHQAYESALLWLQLNDHPQYFVVCRHVIGQEAVSNSAIENRFAAWTCALAPDAIDDYKLPVEFARKALAAESENAHFKGGLGAILFRAGDLDEAHKVL
ncbi:MAG: tetratricopeptide repeat protein, partial [Planctomycetaceae bacterium]|nr:tetratricopeptide repeat protein [Planctomycetaceae bacterium]